MRLTTGLDYTLVGLLAVFIISCFFFHPAFTLLLLFIIGMLGWWRVSIYSAEHYDH